MCDISSTYVFAEVPVDCQAHEIPDCPAAFLTNWLLKLDVPLTCAEQTSPFVTASGASLTLTTATVSSDGASAIVFQPGANVTIQVSKLAGDGHFITGLAEVTRFYMGCVTGAYYKVPEADVTDLSIAADGLSATANVLLTNEVTCNDSIAKLTLIPSWTLGTAALGRRRTTLGRRQGDDSGSGSFRLKLAFIV